MLDPAIAGSFFGAKVFRNLQSKFDGRTDLPIEIQDICDALVELGYQDDIRVVSEEMDLNQLLGTYAQWRESNGVYDDPTYVSLIVYPSNVDQMLQRLVCAKELVHVCDPPEAKTHEADEIMELAHALCERIVPGKGTQIATMKIAKDLLAQGQAQMLLFPKAARLIAREQVAAGTSDLEQLTEHLRLPTGVLEEMLDPDWENVASLLTEY